MIDGPEGRREGARHCYDRTVITDGVRAQFPGANGYLDTASLGLPPIQAIEAMTDALSEWQAGTATASGYDRYVEASRGTFADLVGLPSGAGRDRSTGVGARGPGHHIPGAGSAGPGAGG